MSKKTIFLLQDTKGFNDELGEKIANEKDFEVVGKTVDGISAISMIAEKKPDVLFTELVLSGYDGLSVIQKVKELGLKKNYCFKCHCKRRNCFKEHFSRR